MNSFQLELQEHCDLLSRVLSELSQVDSNLDSSKLLLASDWLNLASGICHVEIQTDRFDDSTQYCGGAYRFEHARSILLSRLATHLSIFNFAWELLKRSPILSILHLYRQHVGQTVPTAS